VVLDFGPSKGELLSLGGGLPASMLVKGMTQLLTPAGFPTASKPTGNWCTGYTTDGYTVPHHPAPWIADERG
jgi:hypothetical protein